MSPFIILFILAILYLCSKPRFRLYVERDGMYLSRSWTALINAFFITLVVCSHGLNLFQTSICDFFPEKCTAIAISRFGQLMVTTFFFYSGYGIMYSLLNREGYCNKLLFPRFVQLCLNYMIAVLIYFGVHCLLLQDIRAEDFLGGLHDFRALGNPTWFILMTLLTYILTWLAFKTAGTKYPMAAVGILTAMLLISIQIVGMHKPVHWVNTILCLPAGMLYFLKGRQMEEFLKNARVPGIIGGGALLLAGYFIYRGASVYTQNIGGILFAVGVTWFAGSFTWNTPSKLLIWLGGSGLFVVYMFHLLPMRIMSHLELNHGNPYLVWLTSIGFTCILAAAANVIYSRISRTLFSRQ